MARQEAKMKRALTFGSILIGLIFSFGAAAVSAQISTRYQADIPFDFWVKGVEHTAGTYVIGPLASNSSSPALCLINKDSGRMRILGFLQASGDGNGTTGTLRFARINGQYILGEVVTPTFEKRFMKLPKMRDVAENGEYPKEVIVRLNW